MVHFQGLLAKQTGWSKSGLRFLSLSHFQVLLLATFFGSSQRDSSCRSQGYTDYLQCQQQFLGSTVMTPLNRGSPAISEKMILAHCALWGSFAETESHWIDRIKDGWWDKYSTRTWLGRLEGVFVIYTLYITYDNIPFDGKSSAPLRMYETFGITVETVETLPINRCRISSSSSMNIIILWFDLVSTKWFWRPLCIILLDCVTPSCFWNRTFPCDITYSMLLMFVPNLLLLYIIIQLSFCLTWLLWDLFFHWFSQLGVVCEDTSHIVVVCIYVYRYTPAI